MTTYENYHFYIENSPEPVDQIIRSLEHDNAAYQQLLQFDYLEQNNSRVVFKFVGVISFGNSIICVFPKYYDNFDLPFEDLFSDFIQIVKVLKRAGETEPSIPDYNHISTNDDFNSSELVLSDKLIRDYLENGLFSKSSNEVTINDDGEINWQTTIESIDPFFSNNRPMYFEYYKSTVKSEDSIITALHKWTIKESLRKYSKILDYDFTFSEDCVNELSELGTHEYLSTILKKELSQQYIDRDILLIKRMLSFLKLEKNENENQFTLYGTGFFHVIWEKACGAFFDNKVEEFKHLIPSPVWSDSAGNPVFKHTLRLDIIAYSEALSIFFVMDAKYYNLKYLSNPFGVSGNPGIGDVSKQFLYYKIFENLNYNYKFNCFLFPSNQEESFKVIGCVSFSLFADLKIFNLYLRAKSVFESYLKRSEHETLLQDLNEDLLTRSGIIIPTVDVLS